MHSLSALVFYLLLRFDFTVCLCSTCNCHWTLLCVLFTCSCDVGYIGDGHVCSDLDECSSPSHNTSCQLNQTCVNSVGSFYCVCEEGYKFDGNMEKCFGL